jgi:hypothetical protein
VSARLENALTDGTVALGNDAPIREDEKMTDHIYKIVDLVGTSSESVTDAIQNAITRVAAPLD